MTRLTESVSKVGCLLTITLSLGLAACGAQAGDATFSEIALPTFSKDRVATEGPVEVRRLLSGQQRWSFETMSPSPDGRYLTDIGWGYGDGASVIDVATGEEIYLPNQSPGGFADAGSDFSPDGSRVAFAFWTPTSYEVRSIGIDGSDPRIHLQYSPDPGEITEVADWSADGRYLLINGYFQDADPHLATIDLNTDEYRIVRTLNGRGLGSSFFSPDGRFVAFDMRRAPESKEHDIFLVSRDGSDMTTLIRTPDHERLLGWLPNGSGILFHRSADDSRAIWKLPLIDGRPAGPPEIVKDDVWTMDGFGFSDDDYFYGVAVNRPQVHTASFDMDTGRMLEELKPVVELSHDGTYTGVWSPDGRRLAHLASIAEEQRIVFRSLTGELLKELPLTLDRRRGLEAWTTSGLLFRGVDPYGQFGLYLISPETGEASFVTERGQFVSEDGSKLLFHRDGKDLIEHDLATGTERVLVEAQIPTSEACPGLVSPDRKLCAQRVFLGTEEPYDRHVKIIDRATGEPRHISVALHRLYRDLTWSRDSRYVLFTATIADSSAEQGFRQYLLRFSAEDGSMLRLMEITEELEHASWFRMSPDGRHISMETGAVRQEIWRMSFKNGGG